MAAAGRTSSSETFHVGGNTKGTIGGDAGLCLGSAQSTTSCGGNLAFFSVQASVSGGLHFGSQTPDDVSFDLPNNVSVAVGNGSLSVNGDIGGTVKVGNVELGRVIPINFQFPNGASALSSTNSKQTQTVRNSLVATPPKLGSGNGTASTGHPAADAVNTAASNVKTAVTKALSSKPKHAKPDSAD
jgi:hypothetical protein